MSRPAQLEQQLARVKEIQDEMLGVDTQPKVVETPPKPEPSEPVTQSTVIETPATISKEDYDKLEQRYRTLQGIHNADISRFRGELASSTAAIRDLETRLAAKENEAKKTEFSPVKYITAEDEAEYGDTLEMVRRAAREEAENIAGQREQTHLDRIAQLESQLGQFQSTITPTLEQLTWSQQEGAKNAFWAQVNEQVPDWERVNEDEKFRTWLTTEDPVTGATRQQFLSQARNEYNAPRVIKFFNEWKRIAAGGQTPAPKGNAQSDLERLVGPGTRKTSVPAQPEPRIWTGADVTQFYKDVQLGKFIGKDDERKKLEQDFFLAKAEGRYRPK